MADEQDVRELAGALPGTVEGLSYGTSAWRVGGKPFLRLSEEPGVLVVWCEDEHEKRSLLSEMPAALFTTPHYDRHASVLVRLAAVDRPRLAALVLDAWRARAPRRLQDQYEERPSS